MSVVEEPDVKRDPFDILVHRQREIADRVRDDVERQLAAGGTATSLRKGVLIVEAMDQVGAIVTTEVLGSVVGGRLIASHDISAPLARVAARR